MPTRLRRTLALDPVRAVLTDLHFWVPFLVLLFGLAVLVICARD